jgi:hypothetical protein
VEVKAALAEELLERVLAFAELTVNGGLAVAYICVAPHGQMQANVIDAARVRVCHGGVPNRKALLLKLQPDIGEQEREKGSRRLGAEAAGERVHAVAQQGHRSRRRFLCEVAGGKPVGCRLGWNVRRVLDIVSQQVW